MVRRRLRAGLQRSSLAFGASSLLVEQRVHLGRHGVFAAGSGPPRRVVERREACAAAAAANQPASACLLSNPCPLQSYYYDGKPMLSDEEFENLKQELQWEGSKVVVLRCGVPPLRIAALRPHHAASAAAACMVGARN